MLLHLVSLEEEGVFERYEAIRKELKTYSNELTNKEEWVIFTKKDLVNNSYFEKIKKDIDKIKNRVFVISTETGENVKELKDALVQHLRQS
jgi:GTP-binding protein